MKFGSQTDVATAGPTDEPNFRLTIVNALMRVGGSSARGMSTPSLPLSPSLFLSQVGMLLELTRKLEFSLFILCLKHLNLHYLIFITTK